MHLLNNVQNILILAEKEATNAGGAAGGANAQSMLASLLPLLMLFVVMYFLLIKPQKKKQKEVEQMRNSLKPGNRIVTIGGFVGKVKKITEDEIYLVLTEGSEHVVIKKWAVQSVLTKDEAKEIEKDSKKAMADVVPELPEDSDARHAEEMDSEIEELEFDEFKEDK